MKKIHLKSPNRLKMFLGGGKISARLRNVNITLFAIVSVLTSVVMLFVLQNITNTVSKDYAKLYSANTVGILNTYFRGEITLITKAARSNAVIDWFMDEGNEEKKNAAYKEMREITSELTNGNLYLGIEKTLNEFVIEKNYTMDNIAARAVLDPDSFDDEWYFECTSSDKDYLLKVDIDKILHRKLVWLNYKVTHNNEVLGVICTGMDLSEFVEKLFAEYDCKKVRGLVMDENGVIQMDSTFLGNPAFLHYETEGEYRIEDEFSNPVFLSAINEYLEGIDGYFSLESHTTVIELSNGKYRYATISPIASTTWSLVTFYDASSLFNIANLLPLLVIIFAMLIFFITVTGYTSSKLIFVPFEKLMNSVDGIKENHNKRVYGIERCDEIGDLANTVQDMKDNLIDALSKVHYDALTGIYNRRFLEENLSRIIKSMSRSGGSLSVMMLDVDYYKSYNDTYGHSMGDACLIKIAEALTGGLTRADDFVARYGGEEFVIILPNTDEKGACVMSNKVLENIRSLRLPHEKSDVANHVTISIGVTSGKVGYMQNSEDFIKRADEAMYMSKQNGRNRYTFIKMNSDSL